MTHSVATAVLLAAAPAAGGADPGPEFGTARMVLQALAGLVLVVGLVVLTRFLLVRLGSGAMSTSVRLREVVRLSPQQALYVVEVDGRRLLLGQHVHLVCELGPAPARGEDPAFARRVRDAVARLPHPRREERS
ncbi:MAG: flagellar biosynthetic protein FliO [Armatimonadota bacterium]|nr:flagellar biosynthetic protein FliO [Armatimonadota bacterium]MDW8155944.1 flagellar biosynthetic protein FliO [Armatimonadota bacterium]